ncbi:hypothetical protein VN97_g10449 [Penicillium thymicola]|uniref:Uncharacterized protein n=1 Tax=Penicillium thymicola TaxID=293382 RepID=A0AAI9X3X4_PENTH|nr:hypothetical protein VN97_g10449 [Penicillium thymicola]
MWSIYMEYRVWCTMVTYHNLIALNSLLIPGSHFPGSSSSFRLIYRVICPFLCLFIIHLSNQFLHATN